MVAKIRKKCLIIEVDPTWQQIISRSIQDIGGFDFELEIASNIDKASAAIRKQNFDLIFLDLSLDQKKTHKWGRDLLVSLKTSDIRIPPTIVVSGNAEFDDIIELLNNFRDCVYYLAQKQRFLDLGTRQEFNTAVSKALDSEKISSSTNLPRDSRHNSLDIILNLCNRFPFLARELRTRSHGQKVFEIENEYDIQYLFLAILRLHFDDVRREECTPQYAGGSSRIDFLLKENKIAIELKKTRKGLRAKEVGEQLIIDISRYQSHPSCETLVCFVYDPDLKISNPVGLENDLNSMYSNDFKVYTVIAPKS